MKLGGIFILSSTNSRVAGHSDYTLQAAYNRDLDRLTQGSTFHQKAELNRPSEGIVVKGSMCLTY